MRANALGFTIVEIAIVLVVISLLFAGLFVGGQALIDSTKVSVLLSQIKDLGAVAREFKGRYGYFPGDLPNAANLITSDGGVSAGCSYAIAGNVGDGLVNTTTESKCAMEHLVKARMLNKAELSGGAYAISSPVGGGAVNLWHMPASNENAVRVDQVPCVFALEIDRKMDNASAAPLSNGFVLGQDSAGLLINTCTVGGANDPVAALLVKY